MARNLVVCCDGTDNQFGTINTNVVRLVQVLVQDTASQVVYYDPGVGTLPEPGVFTKPAKLISQALGRAFGVGLTRNIEEAYTFLMDAWEPGDRVYLLGFSRGAYTVRVLAAMLHQVGLLPRGRTNLFPYAFRLFKRIRWQPRPPLDADGRHTRDDEGSSYWRLCGEFRNTFASPIPGQETRRFPVHFLGVWDTVSSIGWFWNPRAFPFTRRNPSVAMVRHAVALNERRWFYQPNLFAQAKDQDLVELWFPGVHSDVGGGYPESEGGLWQVPFDWMLSQVVAAGLKINFDRLAWVRTRSTAPEWPWAEPMHNSLKWYWWPAEFVPKLVYDTRSRRRYPAIGLGQPRTVPDGAWLHESVLRRIREMPYRPKNLPSAVMDQILWLPDVPPAFQVRAALAGE